MEDTTRGTPPLPPRVDHILTLAAIIRKVDGRHDLGAAALAEAILAHPGFSGCHDAPTALPAQGELGKGLVAELHRMANDAREAGWNTDAECLTRWASLEGSRYTTTPPPLPPGYIDAEHQGEDRKLLEVFYGAANAEGGTTDEQVLRGIRAVMALRPTVAAVRAADAAIADEALEAEFRAWWSAQGWHEDLAALHVVLTHVAWGRHLLSRGEL